MPRVGILFRGFAQGQREGVFCVSRDGDRSRPSGHARRCRIGFRLLASRRRRHGPASRRRIATDTDVRCEIVNPTLHLAVVQLKRLADGEAIALLTTSTASLDPATAALSFMLLYSLYAGEQKDWRRADEALG